MPRVARPSFPDYKVDIRDFGAVSDGQTICTEAINNAIADVNAKGGGTVVIPAGLWISGPIGLLSNVNLYTEHGALVVFTTDLDAYEIVETSFEGLDTRRCQSPLYARNAHNIAITGYGTFDGSGEDWESVDTRPFVLGMVKWVAFGYRGEARGWPRLFSRSGIIEPTGAPKENTWFYKQMWDEKDRFVKIWPVHWNWVGKEGEPMEVRVYANAGEVELFLNGQSLGRKEVDPYRRTSFSLSYEPGELRAAAYGDGELWAEDVIRTTGEPEQLTLTAQTRELRADRQDILIVSVGAEDGQGNPVLWADTLVRFQVEGPAKVLAVSNDDPYDTTGAKVLERKLFRGSCQLILRTTTQPGLIRVTACAEGMRSAVLEAESMKCERKPHVAIETDTDAMWYFAKMDGPH